MGATSWHYFTAYHASAAAALQVLRADVFARGDYVDPTASMGDRLAELLQRAGLDPGTPAAQAQIDRTNRLQQAIATGDLSGLERGDRAAARRVRAFTELARALGAAVPAPPTNGQRPGSIEQLLELAAEAGTHSILDIEDVGRRPGLGVAAPLSATAARRAFGTVTPTHAQVVEHWADVAETLPTGHCRYVTIFQDGQPVEYAFIGCSGD